MRDEFVVSLTARFGECANCKFNKHTHEHRRIQAQDFSAGSQFKQARTMLNTRFDRSHLPCPLRAPQLPNMADNGAPGDDLEEEDTAAPPAQETPVVASPAPPAMPSSQVRSLARRVNC